MSDLSIPPLKKCTKCGEEKPATPEHFHRQNNRLTSRCKLCNCEAKRLEREQFPERVAERKRRERIRNIEKYKERMRKYQQEHKEQIAEWRRIHRDENIARMREYQRKPEVVERRRAYKRTVEYRAYQRQYNSTPQAKESRKRYRQSEKGRLTLRVNTQLRRLRDGRKITRQDVEYMYRTQKGNCWWCGNALGDKFHIEHRIAISRGGTNALRNLCLSCPECNWSKGNKMSWEWNGRLL